MRRVKFKLFDLRAQCLRYSPQRRVQLRGVLIKESDHRGIAQDQQGVQLCQQGLLALRVHRLGRKRRFANRFERQRRRELGELHLDGVHVGAKRIVKQDVFVFLTQGCFHSRSNQGQVLLAQGARCAHEDVGQ